MHSPSRTGALLGAAFLMATSAIGPGFLTQTTVFTAQSGAAFGFVIILSVLLDLGAQVNIWRTVTASGISAPRLVNKVLPGLGHALTALIVAGGLAFNIGNIAGAGLGLEALTGFPVAAGAAFSAILALALFWRKEAGKALDIFAKTLGLLMIVLTAWIAISAQPPMVEVLRQTFIPEKIDPKAIVTIVGGTVGGYISFAGAHRLLEAGHSGAASVPAVTRSAFTGIGVATLMRALLFLAAFGVVAGGVTLDAANPPASMFRAAAGEIGGRFFGLVMWAAAITSVVGCSYTSVSFLAEGKSARRKAVYSTIFILASTLVFLMVGKPVQVLVWAGTVNGFILPLALAAILLAARNPLLTNDYRLPLAWQVAGWLVVAAMGGLAMLG
jgi:Mn2+/Fe2+ NRAMP family transporter